MKKSFIFFCLVFFSTLSFSQKEDFNWCFGNSAGISFNNGSTTAFSNSVSNCADNSSTISDSLGNILFYTNGLTIWNKNHVTMTNGSGLLGSNNSGQCALIVKQPQSNLFYVFTTDQFAGANGLRYSIVDMSLQAGLGAVTTKNILLYTPSTEKIDAVYDPIIDSFWILTHTWASSNFNCYKLSGTGLNTTPVVSTIGSINSGGSQYGYNAMGQLTFSPDGSTVASGVYDNGTVELFDFNHTTGMLSNVRTITGYNHIWGIAFSPDNSKLYITQWTSNDITQFNLNAGSISNIISSATVIGQATSTNPNYSAGYLQLAPDNKIYIARFQMNYIGVIDSPNASGTACGFVNNGIYLGSSATCQAGLSRVASNHTINFTSQNICVGDTIKFLSINTANADSVSWNFNDPQSGSNHSSMLNPYHIFNNPGTYDVALMSYSSLIMDSIHHFVIVHPQPQIDIGNDTILCPGSSLLLDAGNSGSTYLWSTGSTSQSISVSSTGIYWVTIDNGSCANSDSILVTLQPLNVSLGNDTLLCGTSSYILNAGNAGSSFAWSTGDSTQFISVSSSGVYSVTVTNSACSGIDSMGIVFTAPPLVSLGADTTLCPGAYLTLDAGNSGASFLWSNSAITQSITVSSDGIYSVTASIGNCADIDSIHITVVPPIDLGREISLCNKNEVILSTNISASSYLWSTGSANPSITINESGEYYVIAVVGSCLLTDSIKVTGGDFSLYIPNTFTPNNDGLNEKFTPIGDGLTKYHLMIFTRWGEMIFESSDINFGWNGKFKGNLCQNGIYAWVINYHTICTGERDLRKYGSVMLMK
jgi:gliding motility-associated-like protein